MPTGRREDLSRLSRNMRLLCSVAFLIAQADASWLSGSHHAAVLHQGTGVARCSVPLVMQQAKKKKPSKSVKEEENPAVQQARTTILAEIEKEQRSLEAISSALAVLEAAPLPSKLKRAVIGDWKLVFASDAAAVEPFSVGAASGPFVVLEDIFHRMQTTGDTVQSIEGELDLAPRPRRSVVVDPALTLPFSPALRTVVRKIGPFGNSCSSVNGRFSVGDDDSISWKAQYMIDERGREVKPSDGGMARKARATHVSPQLMVMRRDGAADSYVIFTKLGKGELKKELDAYSLDTELILGVQ